MWYSIDHLLVFLSDFFTHISSTIKIWSKNLILESIKGRNSVANLRKKKRFTILTLVLSMMCIQNLVLFCHFVLKILSKTQILTSIKGRHSLANLRKTTIYNTKVDLVDDNVFTKFGLNLPKFELIQAFMHALLTCKNEVDQIKNEGARLFLRFLPL